MTRRSTVPSLLCAVSILAGAADQAHADESIDNSDQTSLFGEIQALDASFFDAYNRCDLRRVSLLVADDLELYDDRDGLELSRQTLLDDAIETVALISGLKPYQMHCTIQTVEQ